MTHFQQQHVPDAAGIPVTHSVKAAFMTILNFCTYFFRKKNEVLLSFYLPFKHNFTSNNRTENRFFFSLLLHYRKHFSSPRSLDSTVCLPPCYSSTTDFLDFSLPWTSKSLHFFSKNHKSQQALSAALSPCGEGRSVPLSAISNRRYVTGDRRDGGVGGRLLLILQLMLLLSAALSPLLPLFHFLCQLVPLWTDTTHDSAAKKQFFNLISSIGHCRRSNCLRMPWTRSHSHARSAKRSTHSAAPCITLNVVAPLSVIIMSSSEEEEGEQEDEE